MYAGGGVDDSQRRPTLSAADAKATFDMSVLGDDLESDEEAEGKEATSNELAEGEAVGEQKSYVTKVIGGAVVKQERSGRQPKETL